MRAFAHACTTRYFFESEVRSIKDSQRRGGLSFVGVAEIRVAKFDDRHGKRRCGRTAGLDGTDVAEIVATLAIATQIGHQARDGDAIEQRRWLVERAVVHTQPDFLP